MHSFETLERLVLFLYGSKSDSRALERPLRQLDNFLSILIHSKTSFLNHYSFDEGVREHEEVTYD